MHALVTTGQRVPDQRDLVDRNAIAKGHDAEIVTSKPRRGEANHEARDAGEHSTGEHATEQSEPEALVEDRRGVGADREEPAVSQGYLPLRPISRSRLRATIE